MPMADENSGLIRRHMVRQLTNAPDELPTLMNAVAAFLDTGHVEAATRFTVLLCIDELVSNIIAHGYPDGAADEIAVSLDLTETAAIVTLEDGGIPFDPVADAPATVTSGPASARRLGGLGIHAVRAHVNDLLYRRLDGRNILCAMTLRPKIHG